MNRIIGSALGDIPFGGSHNPGIRIFLLSVPGADDLYRTYSWVTGVIGEDGDADSLLGDTRSLGNEEAWVRFLGMASVRRCIRSWSMHEWSIPSLDDIDNGANRLSDIARAKADQPRPTSAVHLLLHCEFSLHLQLIIFRYLKASNAMFELKRTSSMTYASAMFYQYWLNLVQLSIWKQPDWESTPQDLCYKPLLQPLGVFERERSQETLMVSDDY